RRSTHCGCGASGGRSQANTCWRCWKWLSAKASRTARETSNSAPGRKVDEMRVHAIRSDTNSGKHHSEHFVPCRRERVGARDSGTVDFSRAALTPGDARPTAAHVERERRA